MREYLQMLIWTMFFIVIVEMTFPVSNIKKYLKFVLGFIVLYVIVSPLVECIISSQYIPGESLENYIQYYQKFLGDDVDYSQVEDERIKQQEGLFDIYISQMEEQATNLLENNLAQIKIENLEVEASFEQQQLLVETIYIDAEVEAQDEISFHIGEKNHSTVLSEVQLEKEIKNCLNDFYNLDNANIYITVQMN